MSGEANSPFETLDGTPETDSVRSAAVLACDHCGKALRGRQRKYCGRVCNDAEYAARHPETLKDRPKRQGPLIPRIAQLWRESPGWRTDREAAAALGVLEGSFAARRRETAWPGVCYCAGGPSDPDPFRHFVACEPGLGWKWEDRRRAGSREREHRLVSTEGK